MGALDTSSVDSDDHAGFLKGAAVLTTVSFFGWFITVLAYYISWSDLEAAQQLIQDAFARGEASGVTTRAITPSLDFMGHYFFTSSMMSGWILWFSYRGLREETQALADEMQRRETTWAARAFPSLLLFCALILVLHLVYIRQRYDTGHIVHWTTVAPPDGVVDVAVAFVFFLLALFPLLFGLAIYGAAVWVFVDHITNHAESLQRKKEKRDPESEWQGWSEVADRKDLFRPGRNEQAGMSSVGDSIAAVGTIVMICACLALFIQLLQKGDFSFNTLVTWMAVIAVVVFFCMWPIMRMRHALLLARSYMRGNLHDQKVTLQDRRRTLLQMAREHASNDPESSQADKDGKTIQARAELQLIDERIEVLREERAEADAMTVWPIARTGVVWTGFALASVVLSLAATIIKFVG